MSHINKTIARGKYVGETKEDGFTNGELYTIEVSTIQRINGEDNILAKNVEGSESRPYATQLDFDASWEDVEVVPPEAPQQAEVAPQAPEQKSMTIMDTQASGILDPNVWLQMKSISNDFFKSGVAPKAFTNPLQILMALQIGKEMGMQPGESLQSLTVVNGNFGVWGKAVPRRLREHGWSLHYEEGGEGNDQYCTATITKETVKPLAAAYLANPRDVIDYGKTYSETVTFKEAVDSGYTTDNAGRIKPGWKPGLNRRLKLRYDCLDVLIKTYVPEVYGAAAGAAEVLMDIPADDEKSPTDERRERMHAAAEKHKELTAGNHTPAAVAAQERPVNG